MKILVFEYITGGGLARQNLPGSLVAEGRMMLQALLDDLKLLSGIELILPLDYRCRSFFVPANTCVIRVDANDDIQEILPDLIDQADAVWPIAPETGGILTDIARQVERRGKILLLSESDVVALCGDKLATCRYLEDHALPVVKTLPLAGLAESPFPVSVIKPIDGVGCEGSWVTNDPKAIGRVSGDPNHYVLQPLISGRAVSISCLFKRARAWLLCCNGQQVVIDNGCFRLQGCHVNVSDERRDFYQAMIDRLAMAIPGLWGYIGIDLIETADGGSCILEINPRLTTSYVGINVATGINVAEQTLRMVESDPNLIYTRRQSVEIGIQ
ncbi:MAG: ATP-grasp domain-containing protein [Gammaproteobacteria bacterium]